ncbi:hypothetical protein [Paenibacillus sp. Y5S-9]|uniref:hypothetical protein n=1 Tax=Paenibacillus TaxID=44249 RepID=UPI0030D4E265
MKNFKRGLAALFAVAVFALTSVTVFAGAVAGGDLWYDGGQTGTRVFSDIYDNNKDDGRFYDVKASVMVCSSVTTSGWLPDKAYITAERSFWCNESSYYDYRLLSSGGSK